MHSNRPYLVKALFEEAIFGPFILISTIKVLIVLTVPLKFFWVLISLILCPCLILFGNSEITLSELGHLFVQTV